MGLVPVHPRARGEHATYQDYVKLHGGSSPRTRGTLPRPRQRQHRRRFIPAHAGNTPFGTASSALALAVSRRAGNPLPATVTPHCAGSATTCTFCHRRCRKRGAGGLSGHDTRQHSQPRDGPLPRSNDLGRRLDRRPPVAALAANAHPQPAAVYQISRPAHPGFSRPAPWARRDAAAGLGHCAATHGRLRRHERGRRAPPRSERSRGRATAALPSGRRRATPRVSAK